MLESVLQDLRYGMRSLIRSPGFTIVAVLTLALGIGANSAVFSVINAVLLRPLPYEEPDRLALIWTNFGPNLPQNWLSGPEFREIQELNSRFSQVGIVVPFSSTITGAGEPEQVGSAGVSGNFFDVLRVDAVLGRAFTADDDRAGAEPVVMLGHGYWRGRFGSDPTVIGRGLTVDGRTYTIIGVLPADFAILHPDAQFPKTVDVWAPLVPMFGALFGVETYREMPRSSHGFRAFARLGPGVSLAQAQADLDAVARRMEELSPDYYDFEGWGLTALSLHGDLVEEVKPALLVLLGAVAFVLLIACVNVANLMLARSAGREREVAVRAALGAGRGRLVRQLLTESVSLSVIGGAAGLLTAFVLIRLLTAVLPADLPRAEEIGIDVGVLVFTLGVAILTGLLFGLAPAVGAGRQELVDSLKEGGRGHTGGLRGRRLRGVLVVSEVALALVLLVGAGLMLRSFARLHDSDPGYDSEQILTMRVPLPTSVAGQTDRVLQFYDLLVQRVGALPGVTSAGAISQLPLSGQSMSGTTRVEGSVAQPEDEWAIEADRRAVSPGYFEAMGYRLRRGRFFDDSDGRDGRLVAIVDETFARRFWPNEDPIGKRISIGSNADGRVWREVVGVIAHPKHYDLNSRGREQAYFPHWQFPFPRMYLAVRAETDPLGLAPAIRQEVWSIDPDQPVADVQTMAQRVEAAMSGPRFNLLLLAGFAGLAVVMAAVGIYGVISYTVTQRGHEIGVRMALGADRGRVVGLVLRQGILQALAGVLVGTAAALALTRLMSGLLYEVQATDPVTYLGVAALLASVAGLAAFLPAVRASRYEPVEVLRDE